MEFVPMSSIEKKPSSNVLRCTDWVATEKVHGSSFQFYTKDGTTSHVGSRRRPLEVNGSFLRCNLSLLNGYHQYVLRAWHIVHSEDRWATFRDSVYSYASDDDEEEEDGGAGGDGGGDDNNDDDVIDNDNDNGDNGGNGVENKATNYDDDDEAVRKDGTEIGNNKDLESKNEDTDIGNANAQKEEHGAKEKGGDNNTCSVRVYGELYGGGGVNKDMKAAVQKEIIYCDDFRFYVFGVTVNRKWLTIAELNDLCKEAGFPYYAKPVCEPKATVEELKDWLVESGFMTSRSSLTERSDDFKTSIEGVVITPLSKPNFRLNAIKFLSPSFNDIRAAQLGATVTLNFCTKQRYHSVISKLDTHEREDTQMVVDMFIADIAKESGKRHGFGVRAKWAAMVTQWLREDEYFVDGSREWKDPLVKEPTARRGAPDEEYIRMQKEKARLLREQKAKEEEEKEEEEEESEDMGIGLFDL